ncbi:hypothetical protein D3C87_1200950 [compost metagenome]
MCLLHASGAQVGQDQAGEVLAVLRLSLGHVVNQVVFIVHAQHTMRRQRFHGEGAGHTHLLLVLVGCVVEVLKLGLGSNGGVDFLLAGDALLPPVGVQLLGFLAPLCIGLTRNLPFLPLLAKCLVQRFA